jgi:hypothetical protein
MDVQRRRDARLHLAQKGHKVLRAMLGRAPGQDLARGDVERGKEIERGMSENCEGLRIG